MEKAALYILICCPLFFIACKEQPLAWETLVEGAGTYASPRTVDLNADGVKDVVLGAGGKKEWEASENGVLAINGKNGNLLWKAPCRNQMVGCPLFKDINGDGTPEVFIGGRSAQFMALDGKNGKKIWEFIKDTPQLDYKNDTTILNFFTPQFVPDQDGDGVEDLLVAYGGFVKARPWETERPAGYLMVFSTVTGAVLAKALMPDGKETYLSPVVLPTDSATYVFFGTGGETVKGCLYRTTLADLANGKIEGQVTVAEGKEKGFIAPPILLDLNGDGTPEVIATAYEGKTSAFDGRTLALLWEVEIGEGYETHSQPAPGQFVGDPTPDFFINYGKGTWPHMEAAVQFVVDGQSGTPYLLDSLGMLQYASPITVSDWDGKQAVLLPINQESPTGFAAESGAPSTAFKTCLVFFGTEEGTPGQPMGKTSGVNIGASPLLDDFDGDGAEELISVINNNPYDPFNFQSMTIRCTPSPWKAAEWAQYMGPEGKSRALFSGQKAKPVY